MVQLDKRPKIKHVTTFLSYFDALDILLKSDKYPGPDIVIIFLFKHCLELISRVVIDPSWENHSLKSFSNQIMKKYPIIREGRELRFDLSDSENEIYDKIKIEPDLLRPQIDVNRLCKILSKYDFGDANATFFRYYDKPHHNTGEFKGPDDVVKEIKKDFFFLQESRYFLGYIFLTDLTDPERLNR